MTPIVGDRVRLPSFQRDGYVTVTAVGDSSLLAVRSWERTASEHQYPLRGEWSVFDGPFSYPEVTISVQHDGTVYVVNGRPATDTNRACLVRLEADGDVRLI